MILRPIGEGTARLAQLLGVAVLAAARTFAQAPEGPMTPPPSVTIQQAPRQNAL